MRPSLPELARLANAAYTDRTREGRWLRRRTYGGRGAAFHAVLWGRETEGDGVLAVRGTANLTSAYEAARLLLGREPRAWQRGRPALADAAERVRGELLLTGHSLGGAFASALAMEAGLSAICFNAPGMRGVRADLAERRGGGHVLNVCHVDDWIWQLSGPGLGVDVSIGDGVARPPVRSGPRGLLDAFRRRRRSGEGYLAFVRRSLDRHRMSAFVGRAVPRPWHERASVLRLLRVEVDDALDCP